MAILAVLIIAASSACQYTHKEKSQSASEVLSGQIIKVHGKPRQYRLVVPRPRENLKPASVLFAFHGAGETPECMAQYSRLDRLATEENCIVVYPQGRRLSWPVVVSDDNPNYLEADLTFFDELLTHLAANYPIDLKRVYALGMSQGGTFVTLLAAKRNDRLAAIVSHSSWLPKMLAKQGIHAQYKLPAMFLAGEEDRNVSPKQTRQAFEQFKTEDHPVEFCLLSNVGHHWSSDKKVDRKIWQFLTVHTRP